MAKKKVKITKAYKSATEYSVTVLAGSIGRLHIRFDGMNDGRSMYVTDNEEIQNALEALPDFNKGFVAEVVEEQTEPVAEAKAEPVAESSKQIEVNGIAEAKTYLVEHFEYSRTSLRTKEQIISAGEEHNITFVGI